MIEKTKHYRNKQLLQLARQCTCSMCGADDGTTVAAHSNSHRHGKGAGIKAEDCFTAVLCYRCHSQLDQGGGDKSKKSDDFDFAVRGTLGQYLLRGLVTIDDDTLRELWKSGKLSLT